MRVPLNDWLRDNDIPESMIYKKSAEYRFHFAGVLNKLVAPDYESLDKTCFVIGQHWSKSIQLPVYELCRGDLRFYLRDNFYNWKLSVDSKEPIEANFNGLFHTTPPLDPEYTGDPLSSVYFEGFYSDHIFSYYCKNRRQWSAGIHGDYPLYTTIFLCLRSLGLVEPHKWSVRKETK